MPYLLLAGAWSRLQGLKYAQQGTEGKKNKNLPKGIEERVFLGTWAQFHFSGWPQGVTESFLPGKIEGEVGGASCGSWASEPQSKPPPRGF